LLLAAAMPPSSRNALVTIRECAEAAANAAAAVSAEPTLSTKRSPTRSTTKPQAIRVSTMPKLGIAETSPARARSRPIVLCRVGIREGHAADEDIGRQRRRTTR